MFFLCILFDVVCEPAEYVKRLLFCVYWDIFEVYILQG